MTDFLIIGGGIAGASVGARLSHLGQVTLLEREDALAFHASGRSAALFETRYGKPSTMALSQASAPYHQAANGGVLTPRGLMLAAAEADRDRFEADMAVMGLDRVGPAEARALWPILDTEAAPLVGYHDQAWDIDTDRLVQTFAAEIRANGGTVRPRAEVRHIDRTASGWRVDIGAEHLEAGMIVNAAGAWVDTVAHMAGVQPLGVHPLRRSIARIPAPDGMDVSAWPMVFGPGENWYAKPDAGALIVSPADEDPQPPMDAWADDIVLAEGLARFEAVMHYEVTRMLANWAGLRTFAPDRQLVLGPDPDEPRFIWMAGQGGYGFQTAPAASQLVADLVAGRAPEIEAGIVAQLTPHRLRD
ncbi:MAG: FAD-dependent oxidoreductase [Salibaculum sp.]|uniref:NAD(P)/FAD-dependent oxidoreductase n=1 Tax=Salibaculum sp. TaxID=2855480 RepID=UPI00286FC7CA|nr:FAD-dependent oxidoreductase [Salibaculum sp.]MDR9427796.1 FAD-dependent oxidoreductase [Salibaculum sp.]